jgi:glycine cleavage system H lipoate-binding protein
MTTTKSTGNNSQTERLKGYRVLRNECIWMKAGVVDHHICDNAYDCNTCAFDRAMQRALGVSAARSSLDSKPEWAARLQKKRTGAHRPCRHALSGRTGAPKICTLNYECYHCEYDQWLDECDLAAELPPPACRWVSGFQVAGGYFYHLGHSWVSCEHGGRVRLGVDFFATRLFGPPSSVSAPPPGRQLEDNRVGWSFVRDGHRAEMLAPVTGTVLAVNPIIREHPEIVYESPFQEGWLIILEPSELKKNLRQLYYGLDTDRWIQMEHRKLMGLTGSEYQNLAATGGTVIDDIFGSLPRVKWAQLTETFLHTTSE